MEYNATSNITFAGPIDHEYVRTIILSAVSFLCREFNCNSDYFNFHCIISCKYDEDVKTYHIKPDNEKDTSNAMFIPTFYQKNPLGRSVIIINWIKIRNVTDSFITSVFVHEFSHYRDYLLCPQLENEFGNIFFLGVKKDSLPDRIGGEFCMRSEMRAKYFQEKYECSLCPTGEAILQRVKKYATKVFSETDFYNIAHLSGQFLCWRELSQQYEILSPCLSKVETYLNSLFEKNPPSNFLNVFSKTDFLEECRRFYKEYTQQNNSN